MFVAPRPVLFSTSLLCTMLVFGCGKQEKGADSGSGPTFEAEAQVLVIPKRSEPFFGKTSDQRSPDADYMETHQVLLKTQLIIERAVKKHKLESLKSFAGQDAVSAVIGSLTVRRNPPKGIIFAISVRGQDGKDCVSVLSAVVDSYKEFLDEISRDAGEETIVRLKAMRDLLQKDLTQRQAAYNDLRKKAPPLSQEAGAIKTLLGAIESKKAALLVNRAVTQGRLAWLEKALADKQSDEVVLLKVNGWLTGAKLEKAAGDFKQGRDLVKAVLEFLKQELEENRLVQKALDDLRESAQAELEKLSVFEFEVESHRAAMNRCEQLFDMSIKRLQEVSLIDEQIGFRALVISAPRQKGSR